MAAKYDPAALAAYVAQQQIGGIIPSFQNIDPTGQEGFYIGEEEELLPPEQPRRPLEEFVTSAAAEDELLRVKQQLEQNVVSQRTKMYEKAGVDRLENQVSQLGSYVAAGFGEAFGPQYNDAKTMLEAKRREVDEAIQYRDGRVAGRDAAAYLPDTQYMESLAIHARRLKEQEKKDEALASATDKVKRTLDLQSGVSPKEEAVLRTMFPMSDKDWEDSRLTDRSPMRNPAILNLANRIVRGEKPDVRAAIITGDTAAADALTRYYGNTADDATTNGRLSIMQEWQKDINSAAAAAKMALKNSTTKDAKGSLERTYAMAKGTDKAEMEDNIMRQARLSTFKQKQEEYIDKSFRSNFRELATSGLDVPEEDRPTVNIVMEAFQRSVDSGDTFAAAMRNIRTEYARAAAEQVAGEGLEGIPLAPTAFTDMQLFRVLDKISANMQRNFNTTNKGFVQVTPDSPQVLALKTPGIISLFMGALR